MKKSVKIFDMLCPFLVGALAIYAGLAGCLSGTSIPFVDVIEIPFDGEYEKIPFEPKNVTEINNLKNGGHSISGKGTFKKKYHFFKVYVNSLPSASEKTQFGNNVYVHRQQPNGFADADRWRQTFARSGIAKSGNVEILKPSNVDNGTGAPVSFSVYFWDDAVDYSASKKKEILNRMALQYMAATSCYYKDDRFFNTATPPGSEVGLQSPSARTRVSSFVDENRVPNKFYFQKMNEAVHFIVDEKFETSACSFDICSGLFRRRAHDELFTNESDGNLAKRDIIISTAESGSNTLRIQRHEWSHGWDFLGNSHEFQDQADNCMSPKQGFSQFPSQTASAKTLLAKVSEDGEGGSPEGFETQAKMVPDTGYEDADTNALKNLTTKVAEVSISQDQIEDVFIQMIALKEINRENEGVTPVELPANEAEMLRAQVEAHFDDQKKDIIGVLQCDEKQPNCNEVRKITQYDIDNYKTNIVSTGALNSRIWRLANILSRSEIEEIYFRLGTRIPKNINEDNQAKIAAEIIVKVARVGQLLRDVDAIKHSVRFFNPLEEERSVSQISFFDSNNRRHPVQDFFQAEELGTKATIALRASRAYMESGGNTMDGIEAAFAENQRIKKQKEEHKDKTDPAFESEMDLILTGFNEIQRHSSTKVTDFKSAFQALRDEAGFGQLRNTVFQDGYIPDDVDVNDSLNRLNDNNGYTLDLDKIDCIGKECN